MNILLSVLLMLGTILLITYPFIQKRQTEVHEQGGHSVNTENLSNEKHLIMSTLGEIEFDYQMNKLSTEDYQSLKSNYARMAADVLEAEETKSSTLVQSLNLSYDRYALAEIDAEIERELQALK